MQPDTCIRCQRRERHGRLLICAACSETLIRSEQSQEPVLRPFEPRWRKWTRENRNAKELGWAA